MPTVWGAAEMARRIARRELSSVDVVRAHIARIEEVDGRLNAVVIRRFDQALAEAAAADERQARGEPLGPLHGVPVTVKENFFLAGTEATIGLSARKGQRSDADGWPVQRLKEAGAIILGKTNVSQLMIWHECDNPVYGCTNNPWDLTRTPGGSTGGEAAIIAARGSPLGLGNDLGGSIRVPCHFCGIHGLKPTSHRLSPTGSVPTLRGFEAISVQHGPMAREVEDLGLALRILADSISQPNCTELPGELRDPARVRTGELTVGVFMHDGCLPASTAIQRAVREAAEALKRQGATIVEFDGDPLAAGLLRHGAFFDAFCHLIGADGGADVRRLLQRSRRDWRVTRMVWMAGVGPFLRMLLAAGLRVTGQRRLAQIVSAAGPLSADEYWQACLFRRELAIAAGNVLKERSIDAILCPPHALPAIHHGTGLELLIGASYSMLFNLLGWPAGVVAGTRVRAGEDSGRIASRDQVECLAAKTDQGSLGLPVGVQVAALPWREDVVLAVMSRLEAHFRQTADYPVHLRVP